MDGREEVEEDDSEGSIRTEMKGGGKSSRRSQRNRPPGQGSQSQMEVSRSNDGKRKERGSIGASDEEVRDVRQKTGQECKIIIRFREEDSHISLSPLALAKELESKIGRVEVAKVLRDGNVLVVCVTEEQKAKALAVTSICKKRVRERKILGGERAAQGVITGIPVGEDLAKLRASIEGGGVKEIKRLKRNVMGVREDSLSVLLEFEGPVPDKIRIGCMIMPVRPYVLPPLRCYKCQVYGHIAAVCRAKQKCPKCGEEHRIEDCEENAQEKCGNCGGQHRVTYGGCEARKRAVEVQQVKMASNLSYAEAVKRVQGQRGEEEAGKGETGERAEAGQGGQREQGGKGGQGEGSEGGGVTLTEEKVMVFVAWVIGCLEDRWTKTERTKMVLAGAGMCLGMKEINYDEFRQRLEVAGDGSECG